MSSSAFSNSLDILPNILYLDNSNTQFCPTGHLLLHALAHKFFRQQLRLSMQYLEDQYRHGKNRYLAYDAET
jgi:hypothetical protein